MVEELNKKIGEAYNKEAGTIAKLEQIPLYKIYLNPMVRSYFPDLNGKAIMDIGCATGSYLTYYAQHFEPSLICGVDLAERQIKIAEKSVTDVLKEQNKSTETKFLNMDVLSPDFLSQFPSDMKFDYIMSVWVICHFPDKETITKFYKTVQELLKPGGICYSICGDKKILFEKNVLDKDIFHYEIYPPQDGKWVDGMQCDTRYRDLMMYDFYWFPNTYLECGKNAGFSISEEAPLTYINKEDERLCNEQNEIKSHFVLKMVKK